jgi:hypothetical protein
MAGKDEAPKAPEPRNCGAPERPKMPENRIIKGNDPKPGGIRAVDTVPGKSKPYDALPRSLGALAAPSRRRGPPRYAR